VGTGTHHVEKFGPILLTYPDDIILKARRIFWPIFEFLA